MQTYSSTLRLSNHSSDVTKSNIHLAKDWVYEVDQEENKDTGKGKLNEVKESKCMSESKTTNTSVMNSLTSYNCNFNEI